MKMAREKISHWLVLTGRPMATGKTRASARTRLKELRKENDDIKADEYYYVGKCVKRKGKHCKIVLEC